MVPIWRRAWFLACTTGGGVAAIVWFLIRTGPKPSRISYPCQQAALGSATAAFGVPVAAALLAARRRVATRLRGSANWIALVGVVLISVTVYTVASGDGWRSVTIMDPPADYHPAAYLVNDARGILPGRYGGVDDLISLMGLRGFHWHRSATSTLTSGPEGMIEADDVVLIKVNAQWAQRGGSNTDVLRGVIRRIVEHPDGFVGEVIVADNGQGSGNLDRTANNAEDQGQSPVDVVNDFAAEGWNVSHKLWDTFRATAVGEFEAGDMNDGYVVDAVSNPVTHIKVSYPKFTSTAGTRISYKRGIWSDARQSYSPEKLVVINLPVFKTHYIYAITASVKNHMGVVTQSLSTNSHDSVGAGGMGSVLAEVRLPDLTILDCIWILARPGLGPSASYANATRRDQLVASTDPVALDAWATKYIMIPAIIENGYSYADYANTQDPDNPGSIFRLYLDRSMNAMLAAGLVTTNDYSAVMLHEWGGDLNRDGRVNLVDFATFANCFGASVNDPPPSCPAEAAAGSDLNGDGVIQLGDFALFALNYTG